MESVVTDILNINPDIKVINSSNDWTAFQYIVFSNLNVAPAVSDKAFAQAMKDLFEKQLPMVVDSDVNIVFGQNFRGLIAMHELVKLRQDLKKNCVAVSSIVFQGRQVKLDKIFEINTCRMTIFRVGLNPTLKILGQNNIGVKTGGNRLSIILSYLIHSSAPESY